MTDIFESIVSKDFDTINTNSNQPNTPPGFNRPSDHSIIIMILLVIGMIGIIVSGLIVEPFSHIVRDISVTLSTISIMTLIYEGRLREEFLQQMKKVVDQVIDQKVPEKYTHIRESGIIDIHLRLESAKIIKKIDGLFEKVIRFHRIYIPEFDELEDALYDAIVNRSCSVEILLIDPTARDAIKRRSEQDGTCSYESYIHHITLNIESAIKLYNRLPRNKKHKFQLRLHDSFVGASLIGLGSEFLVGFYIQLRSAANGIQINVTGETSPFYQEFLGHFKKEWKMAKVYDLTRGSDSNGTESYYLHP